MRSRTLPLLLALLSPWGVRADIAPTQFIGSAITTKQSESVRMERAEVVIEWGMPCSLEATFTMVNTAAQPETVIVGFPMPMEGGADEPSAMPLSITFGDTAAVLVPPGRSEADKDFGRDWLWFRCEHAFQPGATRVVVRTQIRAGRSKGCHLRETIRYCVETGGAWAGPIGEETVTIRFPGEVHPGQVVKMTPAGGVVSGREIRWSFTGVDPTDESLDVSLTVLRPEAMEVLGRLRAACTDEPESSAAAIKLARHLLALGSSLANCGYPPWRLSPDEYLRIRGGIRGRSDRALFENHYVRQADGTYGEHSTEWTKKRIALIGVLAEAGYRDRLSLEPWITEGEAILKQVLEREPENADAWNTYLGAYWRFSFAAMGHWRGATVLTRNQARLIDRAARFCPDDEYIALWVVAKEHKMQGRDAEKTFERIARRPWPPLEYPEINYDYY